MMKQDTREKIIKGAIRCIAQNPSASLEEIAAAAGVGRATLYRYFKSRNELIIELKIAAGTKLNNAMESIIESKKSALDKLVELAGKMVPLGASLNVAAYLNKPFIENDPRAVACYERHLAQAKKMGSELKKEGVVSEDIPLAWVTASLDNLVFAAWEKVQSGDIAPNAAPWLVLGSFLCGVGTTEAREQINRVKEEAE